MATAVAVFAATGSSASGPVRVVSIPAVDYPAGVEPSSEEYRVLVAYEVDDSGRIFRCTVAQRSGQPALDSESCMILQGRARIRPDRNSRRGRLQVQWEARASLDLPHRRGDPIPFALYQVMTADDYPRSAVANQESGTARYEVDVSPTGRPTACRVTSSSGSEILDRQTCNLVMTRGAFIPSVDASGPRAGTASGRITWRLP